MVFDVYLVDSAIDAPTGTQQIDVVLGPGGIQGPPAQVAFAFSLPGLLDPGEPRIPLAVSGSGPLVAEKCHARCSSSGLPTGAVTFNLYRNSLPAGQVSWGAGQQVGVVTLGISSYADGDYFELEPPAIPDLTFAGAAITFSG